MENQLFKENEESIPAITHIKPSKVELKEQDSNAPVKTKVCYKQFDSLSSLEPSFDESDEVTSAVANLVKCLDSDVHSGLSK